MNTSLWSRKSSRQNESRQNDRSSGMRSKMKRKKGVDSASNSGD